MAISNTIVETSFTIGTYVFSFLMGGVVLLSSNFKKWFNNRKNITLSENVFLRIHSQLDELLTEMRIKLNCNRTGICRFHNGGYFFDGISIIKSTTTHESCSLGTVSTIENGQSILLTRFIDKMEDSKTFSEKRKKAIKLIIYNNRDKVTNEIVSNLEIYI